MTGPGRAYLGGAAALTGFALGYALPIYARLPILHYDPLARRFSVAVAAGAVPIAYYGLLLAGLAAALLAGGLTWLLARRPLGAAGYRLAAAWALTALGLVFAYFTWHNWP